MKQLFLVFTFFVTVNCAKSQNLKEAPTLQVGLSGINFSRGNIDPEVVAEIIAEKQKEIKVKLVKNMLLKNLGVDNGLFYAYIDQSIEILTTEKDENTRAKNLLENTVNLAFVVGYAEYYVHTLKKGSEQWKIFRELALSYGVDAVLFEKEALSLKDFAKLGYESSTLSKKMEININTGYKEEQNNKFVGIIIDLFSEQIRQKEQFKSIGLLRTNYLQNYISMNAYSSLENERYNIMLEPFLYKLYALLNDSNYNFEINQLNAIKGSLEKSVPYQQDTLVNAKVSKYVKLLEKTLFEIDSVIKKQADEQLSLLQYSVNENYFFLIQDEGGFNNYMLNKYKLNVSKINSAENMLTVDQYNMVKTYIDASTQLEIFERSISKRNIADEIYNQVGANLDIYIKYYGLVKSLANKGNDWNKILTTISNDFSCGDATVLMDSIMNQYKRARKEITNFSQLTQSENQDVERINSFVEKLQFVELNRYEYIQKYEKEIRPSLIRLSKYSLEFLLINKSIFNLLNCITNEVQNDLNKVNINLNFSFLKVFSKIDEFDQVETYADFLNQLSDAGDVFGDEEMRKSINRIITFVRSYIKVDKDNNGELALNLDVEGFLYSIQKTPYNKSRPLQFHFTLGANTMSFNKGLITDSGDTLRNYSFIGEKIGIKFKLWDFKYVRSFSRGETFSYRGKYYVRNAPPKDPAISNIHLLVYGGGILYNLVNTGTTKDFNSPLLGFGAGVTFFNDLDFNISWGRIILDDKSFSDSSVPTFFNFGFDIQFIEYYDRLNKKRKANQIQKKLIDASKDGKN